MPDAGGLDMSKFPDAVRKVLEALSPDEIKVLMATRDKLSSAGASDQMKAQIV